MELLLQGQDVLVAEVGDVTLGEERYAPVGGGIQVAFLCLIKTENNLQASKVDPAKPVLRPPANIAIQCAALVIRVDQLLDLFQHMSCHATTTELRSGEDASD